ncbi:PTS sorbitol transporter subunit IIA [Lentibacillus kapialis]|uniref:PTS sorbitol transporter subunit IIA n=1 Tax=Lentibacillus kapialis TaxID=340214 RepID=A0A917PY43_9BACI|nr:PTS glucitol/sorbitol transporter subunit IIA [Lentibacillus kapialis]GGJ99029.1 PTS sorbitol transporter subunit IIA [Lentibacillus kapialis]
MREVIYQTNVNKLGESVTEFLDQGMLILFKDNAPQELAEFCILHSENDLRGDIKVGDSFIIGEKAYAVTAVGSAVNENLENLGHITLRFDSAEEAELPGTLSLENKDINQVNIGDVIKVER